MVSRELMLVHRVKNDNIDTWKISVCHTRRRFSLTYARNIVAWNIGRIQSTHCIYMHVSSLCITISQTLEYRHTKIFLQRVNLSIVIYISMKAKVNQDCVTINAGSFTFSMHGYESLLSENGFLCVYIIDRHIMLITHIA